MDIEKLISAGESETLEFKESLALKDEVGEGVSALSNTSGGMILVGLDDSGGILGVQTGKKTLENLANYIKTHTDNHVFPKLSVVEHAGKSVVAIEIKESDEKPVFFKGKAYVRVGKSRHRLSASEIRSMAKEFREYLSWDRLPCVGASLNDIDKERLTLFKERYKESNNRELQSSDEYVLKSLGCLTLIEGRATPTNAGILLFGKSPQKFFPQSAVRIAIYPGMIVGSEHIDIKEFEGDLFFQVDDAEKYIRRYIYSPSVLKAGNIEREEVPQYPYFALRELIVNAVVHRDYSITGSKTIIKIFRDRIEYQSPGALPGGITPKNIVKEQFLRNRAIGKAFNKIRYIEEMGEGWDRIMEEIKNHPLKPPVPKIEDTGSSVIITLFSAKLPGYNGESAVNAKLLGVRLNYRQKKFVELAKKKYELGIADYKDIFPETPERTLRSDLEYLIKFKLLTPVGEKKGRRYRISAGYRQDIGRMGDDSNE